MLGNVQKPGEPAQIRLEVAQKLLGNSQIQVGNMQIPRELHNLGDSGISDTNLDKYSYTKKV
ncbi:hypothetical protein J2S13_003351 [Oikeobacillus pervagus]|uniref:Uncharacterized protein n=1 Tax=Oikeobacillus pervagus TaxID=1325931 RepID=A0AAJ1WKQ0_9BACI|nr:hypothetical protein [Oikeobacillus pervagus]